MVYQGYLKNIPPSFQVAFPALPEASWNPAPYAV